MSASSANVATFASRAASVLLAGLVCWLLHRSHADMAREPFSPAAVTGNAHAHALPPSACGWDTEGAWQIAVARGPSPLHLTVAERAAVTCASIRAPHAPASFVAVRSVGLALFLNPVRAVQDPFLVVIDDRHPAHATFNDSTSSLNGWCVALAFDRDCVPDAMVPRACRYAFFEQKNLVRTIGEIGVAASADGGAAPSIG